MAALKAATSSIPIVFLGHSALSRPATLRAWLHPAATSPEWRFFRPSSARRFSNSCTLPSPQRLKSRFSGTPTLPRSAIPGLKALEGPARRLGLQLQPIGARNVEELEAAFSTMVQRRAQAVLVFNTPPFVTERQRIADLAIAHRLPTMMQGSQFVEAGCLMSYGHNYMDTWRRATVYVDKVLRGANPATLPVEQVKKLELVINLKTAKALGLTIPAEVLGRAGVRHQSTGDRYGCPLSRSSGFSSSAATPTRRRPRSISRLDGPKLRPRIFPISSSRPAL